MNNFPPKGQVDLTKKTYPPGTRIELTSDMSGENIPAGTRGTVTVVDDIGSVHMAWDNGSSLALIPDEDRFVKINEPPKKSKRHDHSR